MAIIPPERIEIQAPETRFRRAVSESTLTRIGASINWILEQFDILKQRTPQETLITNSGPWEVPENVRAVWLLACGGGGGGGPASPGGANGIGGNGGFGAPIFQVYLPVTPGEIYNVTLGNGGGVNSPGQITIFEQAAGNTRLEFDGGLPGTVGSLSPATDFDSFFNGIRPRISYLFKGSIGNQGSSIPQSLIRAPSSNFALGGIRQNSGNQSAGGGGASLGPGGNGFASAPQGGGGGGGTSGVGGRGLIKIIYDRNV